MNTAKQIRPVLPNDRPGTRPIRTFLAEDSPLMMALLARILANDRRIIIVGSATDGQKAFRFASTLQPDLVVTDLHMPGMDGTEVARRLKQLPNPPTIFVVTADDSPDARARSAAAGVDAFVVKAMDLAEQLLATIHGYFDDDLDERKRKPDHLYEPTTPTR